MIRHLSATTHFLGGEAQKLCTAVAELCRTLTNDQSGGYRPELHYMRGPGPKWREKQAQAGTETSRQRA